ncbi:MAG: hypothetical protein SFU98_21435 [Leptospiraceae bacterium]|nr:hypothetical protein [Leptospiraceae bacterium]
MKNIVFVLLLLIFCKTDEQIIQPKNSAKLVETRNNWGYSGWGGSPKNWKKKTNLDEVEISGVDWYYTITTGKASHRSVELKSLNYRLATCKISAVKDNIDLIIFEVGKSIHRDLKIESPMYQSLKEELKDKELGSVECKSLTDEEEFKSCDCVVYIKYEGGKSALKKKIGD